MVSLFQQVNPIPLVPYYHRSRATAYNVSVLTERPMIHRQELHAVRTTVLR